jgi:MoaA/NifB/PqqE/SkfB family radical SAM enzyme
MTHWQDAIPMARRPDGSFEATVDLAAGVYAYKLHVNGERWELDPDNPRTRAQGGVRNNVIVVDGTDEPLLHAPASPDVVREKDGRLRVRAALREGHGERLFLRWDEGAGPREEEMRPTKEEDEHVVFEISLPASARRFSYLFRLASGALVGRAGGAGVWFVLVWFVLEKVAAARDRNREEPAPAASVSPGDAPSGSGASIARAAFKAGRVEAAALPSRLYVTVTEKCNLRCAHCITDAPARTSEGRARTIGPWLVEALREPFAAADYVGFVHGGEAMLAPIFADVLAAIGRARAGRPGRADVHVLSNGMLLDEARFDSLADLGVTSLSISLDGATSRTNDALRLGGRFATIVRNVSRAVERRAARGADVRIGISTVVTASNVHELPALGRLAASIGVDWLKVEELVPCTPRASAEMVFPRAEPVERAMAELRQALVSSRVVLVDHLDAPGVCPCTTADPTHHAFREADDYANRARFLACRMEWEQACIDPDGTVRPASYEAAPIGSLASAPLSALWNGEIMQEIRRSALERTRSALRDACPF